MAYQCLDIDGALLVDTPVSEFSANNGFLTSGRAPDLTPMQGGTSTPPILSALSNALLDLSFIYVFKDIYSGFIYTPIALLQMYSRLIANSHFGVRNPNNLKIQVQI